MILLKVSAVSWEADCNPSAGRVSLDFWCSTLKYRSGLFPLSLYISSSAFSIPLGVLGGIYCHPADTLAPSLAVTAPMSPEYRKKLIVVLVLHSRRCSGQREDQ